MVAIDEDALVCDFAETYHIYDWRVLPAKYAATLAFGLSEDSRIKSIISENKCSLNTMLLAVIADALNLLVWMQTEDGQNNVNRPERIVDALSYNKHEQDNDIEAFLSGDDFEAARAKILGG